MRRLISGLLASIFLFNPLSKGDDQVDIVKLDKSSIKSEKSDEGGKKWKLKAYHTVHPRLFYSSPSELIAEIHQGMPLFSSNYRGPVPRIRKSQAVLELLSEAFVKGDGRVSGALYEAVQVGIEIEDLVYNTKISVNLLPPTIYVHNKNEGRDSGIVLGDLKKYKLPWFKNNGRDEGKYSFWKDLVSVDLGVNTSKGASPGDVEVTMELLRFDF